jgi:hypothetical protein
MIALLVAVWAEGFIILIGGVAPASMVLAAATGMSAIAIPWAVVAAGRIFGVLRIRYKREILGSKYRAWLVQSWLPTFAAAWGSAVLVSVVILPCLVLQVPASTLLIMSKLAAPIGWILYRLQIRFLISRMHAITEGTRS